MKRTLQVTLNVTVETDFANLPAIIDNLKFKVEDCGEDCGVEVAGGAEILNYVEVETSADAPKTPSEILAALNDALDKAEDRVIRLDEDSDFYLYDDDTQNELGECFRVEGLLKDKCDEIVVIIDCDGDAYWHIECCNPYELQLIYENFILG